MTIYNRVIHKLMCENKLEEYDTINLSNANFYLKYNTNIIKHNEVPTLTTGCKVAVVLYE